MSRVTKTKKRGHKNTPSTIDKSRQPISNEALLLKAKVMDSLVQESLRSRCQVS
jgi:hypothetical protein